MKITWSETVGKSKGEMSVLSELELTSKKNLTKPGSPTTVEMKSGGRRQVVQYTGVG